MIKKVYTYSLVATSIFVFLVWRYIDRIDPSIITNVIVRFSITAFLDAILAYGFFQTVANSIIFLSSKVNWAKRLLLGASFIEGVWVGYNHFETDVGFKPRYTITKIEQDFEEINLSGTSYREDMTLRTIADTKLEILNTRKKTLTFLYETKRIEKEAPISNSFVELRLCNKGHSAPPERMEGTVRYFENGHICHHFSKKVSDFPCGFTDKELLNIAKKFYDEENR